MLLVRFQGKPFSVTVTQVYDSNTISEEVKVDWFHEDLQDLLNLIQEKMSF